MLRTEASSIPTKQRRTEADELFKGMEDYSNVELRHVMDLIRSFVNGTSVPGPIPSRCFDEQAMQTGVLRLVAWRQYESTFATQVQWSIQWTSLQNSQPPYPLPPNVNNCSCEFSAWIPSGVVERYLLAQVQTKNPFVYTSVFTTSSAFNGQTITVTLPGATKVIVVVTSASVTPAGNLNLRPLLSGAEQLRVDGILTNVGAVAGGTIITGVISAFVGDLYKQTQASSLIKNQISAPVTARINGILFPDCDTFNSSVQTITLTEIPGVAGFLSSANSILLLQASNTVAAGMVVHVTGSVSVQTTIILSDYYSPPYCVLPTVGGAGGLEVYHLLYQWTTSGVELFTMADPLCTGRTPSNLTISGGPWTWAGVLLCNPPSAASPGIAGATRPLTLSWKATSNIRLASIQAVNNGVIVVKGIGLAGLPLNSIQAEFVKTQVPSLTPSVDAELRKIADDDHAFELPRQWAARLEKI